MTLNFDDIPDDVDVLDAAERDRVARLRSALDLWSRALRISPGNEPIRRLTGDEAAPEAGHTVDDDHVARARS